MRRLVRFFLVVVASVGNFGVTLAESANSMGHSPEQQTSRSLTTNSQNSGTAFSDEESAKSAPEPSNALDSKSAGASGASRQVEPKAPQTSQSTPPYPRKGTDLETAIREKQEFMLWRRENAVNQESIILHLKPGIESRPRKLITHAEAKAIGAVIDMDLKPSAMLGLPDWQVFTLPRKMTERAVVEDLCPKLKQHPDVEDCSQNGAGYSFSAPLDTLYTSDQWSFNLGPGSANIEAAWATTTGSADTVVAILDTGITVHEDLAPSRILPGYDFVSNPIIANDGGGRDADPSDPGNWVTTAEKLSTGPLSGCAVQDSVWHGTHIAGIIGATANNNKGVAGIDWAAKLLPVRVLGKCGNPTNFIQDLSDAILWAAGVDIGTVPVNPNPAKVINMSLSSTGSCPAAVQAAIDQATNKGAVIVASAGNKNISASFWPATCKNVLTVVATDFIGKRAPFSNWAMGVGVSAPGTDIMSTVNPGKTVPVSGSAYVTLSGTSQAAAHVSGVAALMMAANPKLTPFEIREMIKASSKPFAKGSSIILGDCGSGSCGTGIVDAAQAVKLSKMGKAVMAMDPSGVNPYFLSTTPNGQVAGWGNAISGQLGNANAASVTQPTVVPGLAQVDRVFSAGATSWAILKTGEAYALGRGTFCADVYYGCPTDTFSFFGGDPFAPASTTPVRAPQFDNAKQIIAKFISYAPTGSSLVPTIYAVMPSGQLLAWGLNDQGILGLGSFPATPYVIKTPTVVTNLPPVEKVFPGGLATLALDQSGNVWGWGYTAGDASNCNLLGSGAPSLSSRPRQVPSLSNVIDMSLSDSLFAVAVKTDGSVWQWGCSSLYSFPNPVQVPLDHVVAVKGGGYAIRSDGSLWNGDGYAIRSDGSLWSWQAQDYSTLIQLLTSGAIGFVQSTENASPMVRLADGTVFSLYSRLTSAQSPKFGYYELGSGFTGRLNTANTVFDDDTDLQVTISSGAATVNVGQNLNYAVAVKNAGSGTANNAYATVALPSQYKINSIPSGCSVAGQALTCSLGNVGAGQTKTLAINVSALSSGATTATAYASSDSYDYAPGDSVAGVDVNVQAPVGTDTGDVPTLPEWGAIILGLLLLSISYFAQIQPRTAS